MRKRNQVPAICFLHWLGDQIGKIPSLNLSIGLIEWRETTYFSCLASQMHAMSVVLDLLLCALTNVH